MNEPDNTALFRSLVEAIEKTASIEERVARLEAQRRERIENNRPTEGRDRKPRHSGHKGGAFMSEARTEFAERFGASDLQWKLVNKWITQLFRIGSQAASGAKEEDMIWLHQLLSVSLENGFAQAMKDMTP